MAEPRIVVCPGCKAKLRFRVPRTEVVCPRCGTTFPVAELPAESGRLPKPLEPRPEQPRAEPPPVGSRRLLVSLAGCGLAIGCLGIVLAGIALGTVAWIVAQKQDQPAGQEVAVQKGQAPTMAAEKPAATAEEPATTAEKPPATASPAAEGRQEKGPAVSQDGRPKPSPTKRQPRSPTTPHRDQSQPVVPSASRSAAASGKAPVGQTSGKRPPTRLRYHWKAGDEHEYRIEAKADLGETIAEVSAQCSYTVRELEVQPPSEERKGNGTGFVVAPGGYLITCAHVIEEAEQIQVSVGGRQYPGRVIDTDFDQDLALVHIQADNLPAIALADSDPVQLAQEIYAVGFPLSEVLGKDAKITRGTIAGVLQEEGRKRFQIDAAVNPGNSGGPVVNQQGQVVAVASAKLSGIEISQVGMAIPSNEARQLLRRSGIDVGLAAPGSDLAGPQLAKRVIPSVALIEVTAGAPRKLYRLDFSGHHNTHMKAKDPRVIMFPSFSMLSGLTFDRGYMNVSELGEVSQFHGDEQLPFVLGPLGSFVIEQLNSHGENHWGSEAQTELYLVESSARSPLSRDFRFPLSPFGPFGRRTVPERKVKKTYPAIQRIGYRLVENDAEKAVLNKTYEFRTLDDSARPYMVSKGSGTIVFDKKLGMPKRLDYRGTLVKNIQNTTIRVPLNVTYRLRSQAEVEQERRQAELVRKQQEAKRRAEAAKREAKLKQEATVPDPGRVAQLVSDLRAGSGFEAITFAELARRAVVVERRAEVVQLCEQAIEETESATRSAAIRALCKYAAQQDAPFLVKLLRASTDGRPSSDNEALIRALGRLRTPEAIQAIASRLEYFFENDEAKQELIQIGAAAEEAVLEILAGSSQKGRRETNRAHLAALSVLEQIGTQKSLDVLEKAEAAEKDGVKRSAIRRARRAIVRRIEGGTKTGAASRGPWLLRSGPVATIGAKQGFAAACSLYLLKSHSSTG